MESKLKIAVQKSGRLYEDSVKILKECGIDLSNGINKLRAEAFNFPLEVLFLRDDDIPQYVEDGVADCGIVGENILAETNKKIKMVEKLSFGKCRLSIAVQKNVDYKNVTQLKGKKNCNELSCNSEKLSEKEKCSREDRNRERLGGNCSECWAC